MKNFKLMLLFMTIFQPIFCMKIIDVEYHSFGHFLDTILDDYQEKRPSRKSQMTLKQQLEKKQEEKATAQATAKKTKAEKEATEEKNRQALLQERSELEKQLAALEAKQALQKQEQERLKKIAEETKNALLKEKAAVVALKKEWNNIRAKQEKEEFTLPPTAPANNTPITKEELQIAMNRLIESYNDFGVDNKKSLARHLYNVAGNLFLHPDLNDTKNGPFFIKQKHLLWGNIDQLFFYLFCPCTKKFIIEKYKSKNHCLTDKDTIDSSEIMCDMQSCTVYREVRVKAYQGRIL